MDFSKKSLKAFNKMVEQYPQKQAALLPALWFVQQEIGHISRDGVKWISEQLDVPVGHIYGVATFYSMYKLEPTGKHHIQLCQTLPCQLAGSEDILEHIQNKLNIKPGETTEDGQFTLTTVECLASCGTGPMFQINDAYFEDLTPDKVDEILDTLRSKQQA